MLIHSSGVGINYPAEEMFGGPFPFPSYSHALESYLGSCNLFPILFSVRDGRSFLSIPYYIIRRLRQRKGMFFFLVFMRLPSSSFVLYAGFRIADHFRIAPSPVRRCIFPTNGILIIWRSCEIYQPKLECSLFGLVLQCQQHFLRSVFTYIVYPPSFAPLPLCSGSFMLFYPNHVIFDHYISEVLPHSM
jgi:hypothetical protein